MEALREANKAGVIKGLLGVSGVKPRLDIDVMIHDQPKTFNLFILALQRIQTPGYEPCPMRFAELAGKISNTSFEILIKLHS